MKKEKLDINKWRVSIALFVFVFCLFLIPLAAQGEISNPYVVDEKDSVNFGDAGFITDGDTTYHGLENYEYDYVEGYLHLTYTNTHQSCCFAGYPPKIYITNIDPVGATTINVKYNNIPFMFLGGQPSDWYSIDIQFDSGGFRIVVKTRGVTEFFNEYYAIDNLADTDWVSLANDYPRTTNPDGTVTPNEFSMAFTPRPLKSLSPEEPTRNPVIIVPGIMGSELLSSDLPVNNVIWPSPTKLALSFTDEFLDVLKMTENGLAVDDSIIPGDIVRNLNNTNYFKGLVELLLEQGYVEDKDLFVFPYDWRNDIEFTGQLLKEKISLIKTQQSIAKVDVIAHSMGGLVVKGYLKKHGDDSVDNFIDIGTPHLGSPDAFKILNYGDDLGVRKLFGLIGVNRERLKIISQNMPSVYQLLPSQKYLNFHSYIYDLDDLDNNGIRGDLNYDQTQIFQTNLGRNELLIDRADQFHQEIDELDPNEYGVSTYNIVGCGTPTLGKIFMLNRETSGNIEYNISFVDGDGTVPLISAEAMPTDNIYYYKNAIHAIMPSSNGVKELVTTILNNEAIDQSNLNDISTSQSSCPKINGTIVSFHSPIELHIYDEHNKHVGPIENGDIENEIHNIKYEIIEGNKFAFLPNGRNYNIVGRAEDAGSFNVRLQKVINSEIFEVKYFADVPLTLTTEVTFDVNSITPNHISLDSNGDGVFETQIPVTSILNSNEAGDIVKPTTTLNLKGNRNPNGSYISSVQVNLLSTDDNSGILKTEYSLNNGLSWNLYTKPFVINTRGGAKLIYKSTDKAGNIETAQFLNINIIYPGNSGKNNI